MTQTAAAPTTNLEGTIQDAIKRVDAYHRTGYLSGQTLYERCKEAARVTMRDLSDLELAMLLMDAPNALDYECQRGSHVKARSMLEAALAAYIAPLVDETYTASDPELTATCDDLEPETISLFAVARECNERMVA